MCNYYSHTSSMLGKSHTYKWIIFMRTWNRKGNNCSRIKNLLNSNGMLYWFMWLGYLSASQPGLPLFPLPGIENTKVQIWNQPVGYPLPMVGWDPKCSKKEKRQWSNQHLNLNKSCSLTLMTELPSLLMSLVHHIYIFLIQYQYLFEACLT